MRIGILEDEILIAEHLSNLFISKGFEVVFCLDDVNSVKLELHKQLDLLILDIKVPGNEDGVDLANYINKHHKIPFLYISSNTDDKTKQRVLNSKPIGFISKPFKNFDVEIAVDLALERYAHEAKNDFLFVKDKGSWVKIILKDIYFLKASDNYTLIELEKESILITKSLKYFEETITNKAFLKVHRSYIINLNHIQEYSKSDLRIKSINIPISESYHANFAKAVR